jgi:hypothetical protein
MKGKQGLTLSRELERAILRESKATGILPGKILEDAVWLGLAQLRATYEPLKNIGQSAKQLAERGEPEEQSGPPFHPDHAWVTEYREAPEAEAPPQEAAPAAAAFETNGEG